MSTIEDMHEQCDECGTELEIGQIGECDDCQHDDVDEAFDDPAPSM